MSNAEANAGFPVSIPRDPYANAQNNTASYVSPGEAVEMDFPSPDSSSASVTRPNIYVTEFPWAQGDPEQALQQDVQKVEGPKMCSVGNLPAVCIDPRLPNAPGENNPAFIRFIRGNVEIHVYGGDNLGIISGIAESMLQRPPTTPTSHR